MKTIEKIVMQSPQAHAFFGQDHRIYRMAGDASSRSYYRVLHHQNQTSTLMQLPDGASSMAEEYESAVLDPKTLPFLDVQALLKAKGVRVPEIYEVDLPNHIIVLEDLGDRQLFEALKQNKKHYLDQGLKLLAQVSAPDQENLPSSIASQRCFDQKLYMWEFEHYLEYGIQNIIAFKDGDMSKLTTLFFDITQTYLSWEKHLSHRDFHSKNIHVLENDALALIDFQDALMAPVYYDLASLLKDAYIMLDRAEQESFALSYKAYVHEAVGDKTLSDDEFIFRFDLMSLHRNLKAAARFVYIDQVKHNPHYLKDVPQAATYAIETLKTHSTLHQLRRILEPYLEKLIEEV